MDTKNLNPLGIIAFIGAILMIVGVFLAWVKVDFGVLKTWSGWNVFIDQKDGDLEGIKYAFAPLLCLITGILAILLMIVPTFKNDEKDSKINDILGLIVLVLQIVTFVIMILFYTQSTDGHKLFSDFIKAGIGLWLCLGGSILALIGGLMPVVKNKLMA